MAGARDVVRVDLLRISGVWCVGEGNTEGHTTSREAGQTPSRGGQMAEKNISGEAKKIPSPTHHTPDLSPIPFHGAGVSCVEELVFRKPTAC